MNIVKNFNTSSDIIYFFILLHMARKQHLNVILYCDTGTLSSLVMMLLMSHRQRQTNMEC